MEEKHVKRKHDRRNDNYDLAVSTMQKKVNSLTRLVTEAQNGSFRRKKMLDKYRGFVSKLLNEGKITSQDVFDFFGNYQGPKVESLNK